MAAIIAKPKVAPNAAGLAPDADIRVIRAKPGPGLITEAAYRANAFRITIISGVIWPLAFSYDLMISR